MCTKRHARNEGRIAFYWKRGVHLEESKGHLSIRIILCIIFELQERAMVGMVVAAVVTVRLESSVSCWCR